jgi:hypothetical protein
MNSKPTSRRARRPKPHAHRRYHLLKHLRRKGNPSNAEWAISWRLQATRLDSGLWTMDPHSVVPQPSVPVPQLGAAQQGPMRDSGDNPRFPRRDGLPPGDRHDFRSAPGERRQCFHCKVWGHEQWQCPVKKWEQGEELTSMDMQTFKQWPKSTGQRAVFSPNTVHVVPCSPCLLLSLCPLDMVGLRKGVGRAKGVGGTGDSVGDQGIGRAAVVAAGATRPWRILIHLVFLCLILFIHP